MGACIFPHCKALLNLSNLAPRFLLRSFAKLKKHQAAHTLCFLIFTIQRALGGSRRGNNTMDPHSRSHDPSCKMSARVAEATALLYKIAGVRTRSHGLFWGDGPSLKHPPRPRCHNPTVKNNLAPSLEATIRREKDGQALLKPRSIVGPESPNPRT